MVKRAIAQGLALAVMIGLGTCAGCSMKMSSSRVGDETNGRDALDASVGNRKRHDSGPMKSKGNFLDGTGLSIDIPDAGPFPFCENGSSLDAAVLPPGVTVLHDYGVARSVAAMVATDSAIFWVDGFSIHRVTLDGHDTEMYRAVPSATLVQRSLAVDSEYVYFAEFDGGREQSDPASGIKRMPLDDPTSSPTTIVVTPHVDSFVLAGGVLYYGDSIAGISALRRVPATGGAPTTIVRDTWSLVVSIVVVDGDAYYLLGSYPVLRLMRVPVTTVASDTQTGILENANLGAEVVHRFPDVYGTVISDGTTVFWQDPPAVVAMLPGRHPTAIAHSPSFGFPGTYRFVASAGWVYWDSTECAGLYRGRSDGSEITFLPAPASPQSLALNRTHAFVFDSRGLVFSMPR